MEAAALAEERDEITDSPDVGPQYHTLPPGAALRHITYYNIRFYPIS